MLLRDAPATGIRTSRMIILQANKNCAQETSMIRPSLEDQFTKLTLGQSTAFCWSVHKRRKKGKEERQLWESQWHRIGGGDREKDQKSLAFKHFSSEQVFPCWMCSLSMLGGATIHEPNGFPPAEHDRLFLPSDGWMFYAAAYSAALQIPRVTEQAERGAKVSCHSWELGGAI